jgi:hypothetical protein
MQKSLPHHYLIINSIAGCVFSNNRVGDDMEEIEDEIDCEERELISEVPTVFADTFQVMAIIGQCGGKRKNLKTINIEIKFFNRNNYKTVSDVVIPIDTAESIMNTLKRCVADLSNRSKSKNKAKGKADKKLSDPQRYIG